jgi:glycosyltransferase involved in cell wall biosynthesis
MSNQEKYSLHVALVRCGALRQQHHLLTLCGYLVSQGIQVDFFSLQAPESEVDWFAGKVPGVNTHYVGLWPGKGVGRFVMGGLSLRRQLRKLKADILYVIDSWTLPYVAVATNGLMRWKKCPTVYHTFDMLVPNVASRLNIALERYTARRSSLNINTDQSRAQVVKALFGLPVAPLSVPLRLPRETTMPHRDAQLRTSLLNSRHAEEAVLVVNPTRLTRERLGKEIIQAFAELPSNYHLVTVNGEGAYAQECEGSIQRSGLQERVHILSPMPHDDLLKICACADVGLIFHNAESSLGNYLCHPSRLAYYLALGLPVVATDVPVLAGVIYRYGLGECCNPFKPESIASALQKVCEEGAPLPDRKKNIRRAFESELYYERSAHIIVDALRNLRTSG